MPDGKRECFIEGKKFGESLKELKKLSEIPMAELTDRFEEVARTTGKTPEEAVKDHLLKLAGNLAIKKKCYPSLRGETAEFIGTLVELINEGNLDRVRMVLDKIEEAQRKAATVKRIVKKYKE